MERDNPALMMSEVIRGLPSQTSNKKRSVKIGDHRTSVSLEPIFWGQLRKAAFQQQMSVNELIALIGHQRDGSLSSAIRVFVLENVYNSHCFDRAVAGM